MKGIGGYHLVCDAGNDAAVQRLRDTKPRPHKPLAVMFPAPPDRPLAYVSAAARLTDTEADLLLSAQRPVVIVRKQSGNTLSDRHRAGPGRHRRNAAVQPAAPPAAE